MAGLKQKTGHFHLRANSLPSQASRSGVGWGDSDSSGKEVSSGKSLVLTFYIRHGVGARHHLEIEPTVSDILGIREQ